MLIEIKESMRAAIQCARKEGTPYGATLLHQPSGRQLVVANSVRAEGDPTAHAEVNAIRQGARQGINLRECWLISTCEPCPMCAMAAVWAGIRGIYFGASIDDAGHHGHQVKIYCREIADRAWYDLKVEGEILREDCLQLFRTEH